MKRQARCGMVAMVFVGAIAGTPARALDLPGAMPKPAITVEQFASRGDDRPRGPFATATETEVWAGRGRLAVGIGVEQPWTAPPALAGGTARSAVAGLRLGVSLRTSARSRLIWQTPAAPPGFANAPGHGDVAPRAALDLRRSDPYRSLLRGTFRYQLAPGTALALRANARRVGVTFTRQW